jgi:hypothetical protein
VASFELLSSGPATRPRRTMTVARLDESTIRSAQTPGRGRRLLSHGTRVLRRRSSETLRSRQGRQSAWTRPGCSVQGTVSVSSRRDLSPCHREEAGRIILTVGFFADRRLQHLIVIELPKPRQRSLISAATGWYRSRCQRILLGPLLEVFGVRHGRDYGLHIVGGHCPFGLSRCALL